MAAVAAGSDPSPRLLQMLLVLLDILERAEHDGLFGVHEGHDVCAGDLHWAVANVIVRGRPINGRGHSPLVTHVGRRCVRGALNSTTFARFV